MLNYRSVLTTIQFASFMTVVTILITLALIGIDFYTEKEATSGTLKKIKCYSGGVEVYSNTVSDVAMKSDALMEIKETSGEIVNVANGMCIVRWGMK